jgi:hypothetical protein
MSREKLTLAFLWLSILGWGIGLGAKIFDLLVLGSAWGASPPTSLALLPYGARWPIDPGTFFQPLSVVMLLGMLGAYISGRKTSFEYRRWLLLPLGAFLIIWLCTPTLFWPMINQFYGAATGRHPMSELGLVQLVRRWFILDSLRIVMIAIGFISSVKAISIPYPGKE